MIGIQVKYVSESKSVIDAVNRATFRNIGHAAATIRKTEIKLIDRSPVASDPGSPIHTRRGLADRAIQFFYDKSRQEAYIGPAFSKIKDVLSVHEFGGEFRGQEYPERSFAGPALEQNLDRFAREWQGSI